MLVEGTRARRRSARPPTAAALQMIFQDPYSSLNPRMTVRQALAELLRVHKLVPRAGIDARCRELLDLVGPAAERARRLPEPVLGRPAPAHLDRARARARARDPDRRRARLGARRLGAGDRAQPARRPAPAARADDAVRRPQHGRRAPRLRPCGRDVPRPHRRDGARRRSCSRTRAIRTPRRCCAPCPASRPGTRRERDAVVGDPPSPSTCRPAAASIRAARAPPRSAACDDPPLELRGVHAAACHFAWTDSGREP